MEKIKILHIQLLPLLSGVQNMMLKILTSLDSGKYEIYVISKPGGPLEQKVKELGFNYLPLKYLRRNFSPLDLLAFLEILRICLFYKFDIVHTHSSKTGFLGRIAARLAGVPKIIHTVHGFPFHSFQPKILQKIYMNLEKFASLFCDKVVFVNNSERRKAIAKKIVSRKKAVTIYNGIEIPYLQKRFGDDNEKVIIGSVLRFSKQKNIINTIKVAIEVCRLNRRLQFIFVGDGELYREAKRMVKKAGMEKRILLPGWKTDIENWLLKFDVFLLYSKWEGLPISILEAMSYGLPIIASDIEGNNELVSEENGFLVSVKKVDKLEQILINLPSKMEELKKMGENSRKKVREKFGISEFIRKYQELYDD